MPVLNEERDLREAVQAILTQDYPGETEVVLSLGPSHDATDRIAAELSAEDPRIHTVHNPEPNISRGLNLAIRASAHPIVVRVDAHATLSEGYTRAAVATLLRTGAANVGGIMSAKGRTPVQSAIAVGYNSRAGLGGGAYHGHGAEGPAESAYLGVFRREPLEAVGLFDESIARGEDWELNLRLREAGHLVWFDPQLRVTYWPRASWGALARQFHATGVWRGDLVRRLGAKNSLRYFAPPLLVVLLALAVIVGVLQLTGVLHGIAAAVASLVYVPVLMYAFVLLGAALTAKDAVSPRVRLLVPAVLLTMHVYWGTGFLRGVVTKGEGTVDTSRIRSAG
ncbi:MAG: glycosyltransferase [Arthrobacter sp.]|nr:glycosyltransferase [Arthrobacter sp.]